MQHCYKNHFLLKTHCEIGPLEPDQLPAGHCFFHLGSGICTLCSKKHTKIQTRPPKQGLWCIAGASNPPDFGLKYSKCRGEKWKMKQRKIDRHIKSAYSSHMGLQARFLLLQVFGFFAPHVPEKSEWKNSILIE